MAEVIMSSLEPNSHKYHDGKEKKKKELAPVVKHKTSVKKKPMTKRVGEAMISEDLDEVKSYLLWDILIPALKDTAVDLIKKGADAIFYGGKGAPSNVRRNGSGSRVSYANYYNSSRRETRRPEPRRYNRRAMHDFGDIVFSDRHDAEGVLSALVDLTMEYGFASVADFYELSDMPSEFTDNKYGWGELADARVLRVREGYALHLPKPEPIDTDELR